MNDLISRKALLAKYDRVHIGEPGKARKLIEDAPAEQKWIPVTERLPEKNEDGTVNCVLVTDGCVRHMAYLAKYTGEGKGDAPVLICNRRRLTYEVSEMRKQPDKGSYLP